MREVRVKFLVGVRGAGWGRWIRLGAKELGGMMPNEVCGIMRTVGRRGGITWGYEVGWVDETGCGFTGCR